MIDDWVVYSWFCPNCKSEVAGIKNAKNVIKVTCKRCRTKMTRTILSRTHDHIDLYAPKGQGSTFELREY